MQQAEARLKEEASAISLKEKSDALARIPRLDTTGLPKPYVNTKGDVARADAHRQIDEDTRKLANGIRKVEDPVVMKKKLLEV